MSDNVPAAVPIAKTLDQKDAVKLRRINSDFSKPYPPDGDGKLWWNRLKAALGTTSSDFVNVTLVQIQKASRMPSGGISEMSVNAVLAFIEAAEPKNEMEAALAIQMACTHAVAMAVLEQGRWRPRRGSTRRHDSGSRSSATERFHGPGRDYAQARGGGTQVIRIEKVEVKEGGQAVIGNLQGRTLGALSIGAAPANRCGIHETGFWHQYLFHFRCRTTEQKPCKSEVAADQRRVKHHVESDHLDRALGFGKSPIFLLNSLSDPSNLPF